MVQFVHSYNVKMSNTLKMQQMSLNYVKIIISPSPMVLERFIAQNVFVLCRRLRSCRDCTYHSSSSPLAVGQFQSKLAQRIHGRKCFLVCSTKCPGRL